MNEEEILQKLNKYMELINKGYCDDCNELNVICGKSCNGSKNVKDAIESLIKIYKQEKEKNEELEKLVFQFSQERDIILKMPVISKDKIIKFIKEELPEEEICNTCEIYDVNGISIKEKLEKILTES